jgi:membrane protein implicated in regulation of membrane protease activity
MTWWGWIIAGAILLGAELTFVNAQFYLVFIGSAAILVGVITALTPAAPSAEWALFAVLAIVSMVTFRSRVYRRFRGELPAVNTGPAVGGSITLRAPLAVGESCQAEYGGSFWTVCNDGDAPIPSGTRTRIVSVRDLTLFVRPDA